MGPLAVDPEALFAAGSAVVAGGDGLNAAMTVLTAGFGANTGMDIAGEIFGLGYQSAAESLLTLATAAINACHANGIAIEVGASHYSQAEAASTLGGGAGVLQAPGPPAKMTAPGPPGTLGPGEPPPLLWAIVQSFVDDVWPNGDVAALHAAAGCWRTFGAAAGGMRDALNGPKTLIGTQQMPEGGKVIDVLSRMGDAIGKLGEQSGKMAETVDGFANQVARAQNDIRDLLHRLESLTDLWHDVVSILDGDALEEIKKIAQDINAVLHDLGREARAFEQGIKVLTQVADGLVVDMEKFMRRQFTHFLGDAVGNQVATVFDTVVNANEGFVIEGVQTVQGLADFAPEWFLLDPKGAMDTWKGTAESMFRASLLNEMLHPREGAEANVQMWKSLLHLDDWSTARPGLGAGKNALDALTFFIPGAGEAGAGADAGAAAARGAESAGELAQGARAAGRVGEFATASGALSDIGKASTGLTKDLDGLKVDMPKTDIPTGGRPVGTPPVEAPGPPPRPVESAPPGTPSPHSPTSPGGAGPGRPGAPDAPHHAPTPTPGGGPHEPASGPHEPVSVPAAPGEHLPPHTPQLAEPAPTRVPASTDGAPVEPAPSVHTPQQAPALASSAPHAATPHFNPPSASPAELPTPGGGGWHGPGDGGTPGGGPHDVPPDGDGPPGHGHEGAPGDERQDPVHSDEPSGDGWQRLPDTPTDPDYGQPLLKHWDFEGNPADPSQIRELVSKLIKDPEAPFGRDELGHAYTQQEYADRFNSLSPEGDHWMDFPRNDGAVPGTKVAFTDADQFVKFYGRLLDRIGNDGKYLGLMEDGIPASWEERALHVNSLTDPYHTYTFESLPEGWHVEVSEVAPGLGQPGGSTQVRILDSTGRVMTVEELTELGILK